MFGARRGHPFDKHLAPIAQRITSSPNAITVIGFLVTVVASYVLSFDLFTGGILVLIGGLFDILDGVVARVNDKCSHFGAYLDSVLDRYSDAAVFLGISWYLWNKHLTTGVVLSLCALTGSLLISYSRARAEGLGVQCKVGLMERPERLIIISLGAILNTIVPVLWILSLLTHITVLQRTSHVYRAMQINNSSKLVR